MQLYCASFTGDLRQVIDHVLGCYPQASVYAAGWSLGANILVRYLGEVSYVPMNNCIVRQPCFYNNYIVLSYS
jgi:predicted alpha/beta-fold hydrolase